MQLKRKVIFPDAQMKACLRRTNREEVLVIPTLFFNTLRGAWVPDRRFKIQISLSFLIAVYLLTDSLISGTCTCLQKRPQRPFPSSQARAHRGSKTGFPWIREAEHWLQVRKYNTASGADCLWARGVGGDAGEWNGPITSNTPS